MQTPEPLGAEQGWTALNPAPEDPSPSPDAPCLMHTLGGPGGSSQGGLSWGGGVAEGAGEPGPAWPSTLHGSPVQREGEVPRSIPKMKVGGGGAVLPEDQQSLMRRQISKQERI